MNIETFLNRMFKTGSLEVRLPGGRRLVVGDGSQPSVAVTVTDNVTLARIIAQPSLGVGEAYMDGRLIIDRGNIHDLVDLASRNTGGRPGVKRPGALGRWWTRMVREHNERQSARRNVAHHYDLSLDLYRTFLDDDLQYSCAVFERPGMTLEEAQAAKKRRLAAKLQLSEGQRVLDIGCGWGAFMGYAAERYAARCVGVTVSTEQVAYVKRRYEGQPVEPLLMDYRDYSGEVDHVVSMGMFEHVGHRNYRAYFRKARSVLKDGGLFLLHTIVSGERSPSIEPWLDRYIFPNGVLPTVGQIGQATEDLFVIEDFENFGAYYDRTLMAWHANFMRRRGAMAAKYGERFCRMWDYYLACCAGGFRSRRISVGQFVLSPHGVPGGWRLER